MSTITVTNIQATGETASRSVSGVAAAWLRGDSTASLDASFNISSGTDNGTGDYSYSLTNSFSTTYYSQPSSARVSSGFCRIAMFNASRQNASTLAVHMENDAGTPVDVNQVISAFGDLA